jgi:glycosidase
LYIKTLQLFKKIFADLREYLKMKKSIIAFLLVILFVDLSSGETIRIEKTGKSPEWMSKGVMYQIWLRSFTIEGTINAAEKKLPEIAELGATIVYLCPVMLQDTSMDRSFWSNRQKASPANNPRNPYRIMDYTKVDPEYGSENDLKGFVKTAHHHGLKVMLDLVYLHTGPSNVLMKHPEYYKKDAQGNLQKNEWNFYDLDFSNKSLRVFLWENMVDWIKKYELDGWRCDVSGGVPLDFWEEARERMEKINPNIGMLAEADKPEELVKAFDASYGFGWFRALISVFVNGESAVTLPKRWNELNEKFPEGSLFIRWVDNHDQHRPEIVFSKKGSMAVNVLNFMIDGIPFIYNGQEIGDASPYGIEYYPEKSYSDNGAINWTAQGIPQQSELRKWYKSLIAVRNNEPVLHSGKTIWLETDNPESVIAFLRLNDNEKILTVINVSNRKINKVNIKFPNADEKTYQKILTNGNIDSVKVIDGIITISLNSFGYYIGK